MGCSYSEAIFCYQNGRFVADDRVGCAQGDAQTQPVHNLLDAALCD
jgi:hypothetical protein